MKKLILSFIAFLVFFGAKAQEQMATYDSFQKDRELKSAILRCDVTSFMRGRTTATFTLDTTSRQVSLEQMNKLLKRHLRIPKNGEFKKASESNNGYTQTYGIYKDEEALTWIRVTISMTEGTLEEVAVEKNN